jgi:prepilin-type N-terminal cleavage/methylation domain-containing protein
MRLNLIQINQSAISREKQEKNMKSSLLLKFSSRMQLRKSKHRQNDPGFTIIELAMVMLMIGILSSIAAPGWLAFINNQRLRASQGRVYSAMQLAQSFAKRDKVSWQASFRTVSGVVQVAVYRSTNPLNLTAFRVSTSGANTFSENTWINLEQKVGIDTTKTNLITVDPSTNAVQQSGGGAVYTAIFNRQGCFVDNAASECTDPTTVTSFNQRGLITLKHDQLGTTKCAVVESLLGAMRTGDDAANCN